MGIHLTEILRTPVNTGYPFHPVTFSLFQALLEIISYLQLAAINPLIKSNCRVRPESPSRTNGVNAYTVPRFRSDIVHTMVPCVLRSNRPWNEGHAV